MSLLPRPLSFNITIPLSNSRHRHPGHFNVKVMIKIKNDRTKGRSSYTFRNNIIKRERIVAFSDVTLCIGWFNITDVSKEPNPFFLKSCYFCRIVTLSLILRRSRTGTVWFYTTTSNKRAARPKLYTKSLTMDLKLMYSRFTLVRISINL